MRKYFLSFLIVCFPVLLFSQVKQDAAWVESLKKNALSQVQSKAKNIQEMVDMVFSYGELGFQEFETSRYLTEVLAKMDLPFKKIFQVFQQLGRQNGDRVVR